MPTLQGGLPNDPAIIQVSLGELSRVVYLMIQFESRLAFVSIYKIRFFNFHLVQRKNKISAQSHLSTNEIFHVLVFKYSL